MGRSIRFQSPTYDFPNAGMRTSSGSHQFVIAPHHASHCWHDDVWCVPQNHKRRATLQSYWTACLWHPPPFPTRRTGEFKLYIALLCFSCSNIERTSIQRDMTLRAGLSFLHETSSESIRITAPSKQINLMEFAFAFACISWGDRVSSFDSSWTRLSFLHDTSSESICIASPSRHNWSKNFAVAWISWVDHVSFWFIMREAVFVSSRHWFWYAAQSESTCITAPSEHNWSLLHESDELIVHYLFCGDGPHAHVHGQVQQGLAGCLPK